MRREAILDEAKSLITGDRAQTYGDAHNTHARIGKMWGAILDTEDIAPDLVALMMGCVKIARAARTPEHKDSWIDLAGYAALGGEFVIDTDLDDVL